MARNFLAVHQLPSVMVSKQRVAIVDSVPTGRPQRIVGPAVQRVQQAQGSRGAS